MARIALSIVPVIAYLFLLSWVPLPDALASADLTTNILARLVFVGTIILGLLSGFGAINNAWDFFPLFLRNRYAISFVCIGLLHIIAPRSVTTAADITAAEQSLLRVREDLESRRTALQRHEAAKVRHTFAHRYEFVAYAMYVA